MMKDVRKALGTFWGTQFLQGVVFEDFHQKHGFPGPPGDNSWAVYRAAAQKQRLAPRLRAAPLFAFLLAAQFVFEFTVLQLTGECFAFPRPWFVQLPRAEQILTWAWNHAVQWFVEQKAYVKLFSSKSQTTPQWSAFCRLPRRSIILTFFRLFCWFSDCRYIRSVVVL